MTAHPQIDCRVNRLEKLRLPWGPRKAGTFAQHFTFTAALVKAKTATEKHLLHALPEVS
jgi:hypothetical protein